MPFRLHRSSKRLQRSKAKAKPTSAFPNYLSYPSKQTSRPSEAYLTRYKLGTLRTAGYRHGSNSTFATSRSNLNSQTSRKKGNFYKPRTHQTDSFSRSSPITRNQNKFRGYLNTLQTYSQSRTYPTRFSHNSQRGRTSPCSQIYLSHKISRTPQIAQTYPSEETLSSDLSTQSIPLYQEMPSTMEAPTCHRCCRPLIQSGFYVDSQGHTIYHSRRPCESCYPEPPPVMDMIFLSAFATICCFCPLGLIALTFSFMADAAVNRGDYEEAEKDVAIAGIFIIMAIFANMIIMAIFLSYLDSTNPHHHHHHVHHFPHDYYGPVVAGKVNTFGCSPSWLKLSLPHSCSPTALLIKDLKFS